MPDYKKSKIYKLTCDDPELVYYGATIQRLSKRLGQHKEKRNVCNSKLLFEVGNVKIELVEKFECEDKEELNAREAFYIRNNKCVNKRIENRTKEEYYEENKEEILEKNKEYKEENKEKIKEKNKEYYEENKEEILEKNRAYFNKKVNCPYCDKELSRGNLRRHIKTFH